MRGFVSLLLEGQLSHTLFDRLSLRELLIISLNQLKGIRIPSELASSGIKI